MDDDPTGVLWVCRRARAGALWTCKSSLLKTRGLILRSWSCIYREPVPTFWYQSTIVVLHYFVSSICICFNLGPHGHIVNLWVSMEFHGAVASRPYMEIVLLKPSHKSETFVQIFFFSISYNHFNNALNAGCSFARQSK